MAIRDRSRAQRDTRANNKANAKTHNRLTDLLPTSVGSALEGLLSFASDMTGQAKGRAEIELERLAQRLDLVTRREFEAVRAIAIAARAQAERLEAQLNGRTGGKTGGKKAGKTGGKNVSGTDDKSGGTRTPTAAAAARARAAKTGAKPSAKATAKLGSKVVKPSRAKNQSQGKRR